MVNRAILAILLVLSACRAVGGGGDPTTASPRPSPQPAVLELHTVQDGCCFIEGALSFATLEGPSAFEDMALEDDVDRDFKPDRPFVIGVHEVTVAPGHYVLRVWQRPCDGNCGYLDPPTGKATAEFDVADGQELPILITFRLMDPASVEVGERS